MKLFSIALTAGTLVLGVVAASAQPVISAKSGTVALVEGQVYIGDQAVESSLTKFPDVKENGVLRTEEGRAEVLLTPGVSIHVGENSSFRLITNRLIDTRLELLTGSAVVDAVEIAKDTNVTIVCKQGTVAITKAGHYRFDIEPARVKVFAGAVDVTLAGDHILVPAGKMLSLAGLNASAEKFDKEDTDSLDNWARRRGEAMALANVSAAKQAYNSYATVAPGGMWGFNSYLGLYTYIPYSGRLCDAYYGYCYWSPSYVNRLFYQPPPATYMPSAGGFGGAAYPTMGATSGGYSGTVASAPSMSSAPAAAASSGSGAASSAGSSSVGHGSAGGGGGVGGGGGRGH